MLSRTVGGDVAAGAAGEGCSATAKGAACLERHCDSGVVSIGMREIKSQLLTVGTTW